MRDIYIRRARYVSNYDGDTIRFIVDLGFYGTHESSFRILGIDTPELRGVERDDGLIVRDAVEAWMLNAEEEADDSKWPLTLQSTKAGKYGRWLADVFDSNNNNLGTDLLEAGMAVPYGETWKGFVKDAG